MAAQAELVAPVVPVGTVVAVAVVLRAVAAALAAVAAGAAAAPVVEPAVPAETSLLMHVGISTWPDLSTLTVVPVAPAVQAPRVAAERMPLVAAVVS